MDQNYDNRNAQDMLVSHEATIEALRWRIKELEREHEELKLLHAGMVPIPVIRHLKWLE